MRGCGWSWSRLPGKGKDETMGRQSQGQQLLVSTMLPSRRHTQGSIALSHILFTILFLKLELDVYLLGSMCT